jgi:hypothetical protein
VRILGIFSQSPALGKTYRHHAVNTRLKRHDNASPVARTAPTDAG